MKSKLKSCIIVLILFLIKNTLLISEEFDFSNQEIQQGTFKYSFKSPENWDYYSKDEKDGGLYVILRPVLLQEDSTFHLNFFPYSFENEISDFPTMYIFSKSKSNYKIFTLSNLLNSFDTAYKQELIELPDNSFEIDFKKKDEIIFKHYFGFNNIFYVTFAYLEQDDNFLTFAFSHGIKLNIKFVSIHS